MEHGLNSGSEGVSSGLEDGAAAALDFVRSVDQTPAERADLLADLSPDPAPDRLIGLNLMHLLWFVSENVIGVAKPQAGASQRVRRLGG